MLFKYKAKNNQAKYGMISQNAVVFILKNARAIKITSMINATKINNATSGCCAPKNAKDHSVLNTKLIAKYTYALVLSEFLRTVLVCIIKNNATPIKKYNIVHATGNTQPAGVNTEFFNVLYHIFAPPDIGVTNAPKIPGIKDKNIAKTNFKKDIFDSFG